MVGRMYARVRNEPEMDAMKVHEEREVKEIAETEGYPGVSRASG